MKAENWLFIYFYF